MDVSIFIEFTTFFAHIDMFSIDCKSLAPIWEIVAQDFASESSVLIAKVDAEAEQSKATAQEQGVSSYPTITYFPKGSSTPEAYAARRLSWSS